MRQPERSACLIARVNTCRGRDARATGTILVAVLVVTALAAMVAMSLLYRMRAEVSAAAAVGAHQQAYAVAQSGVQRAIAVLQASPGDAGAWWDNPDLFRNQYVCSDARGDVWYFTLYASNPADSSAPRSGIIDEASKINLNTATAEMLARLPNMTPELVDSLMVWRGGDPLKYPDGATEEYYNQLPVPYVMKKGPLATMEELLLVKAFTGSIVYGEDYNLNGILDKNEDDGDDSFPPDNRDGVLDTGLMGVATVISYERNVDSSGKARVNLNGDPAALASAGLPAQTLQFLQVYRAEGGTLKHPSQLLNMRYESKQQKNPDGSAKVFPSGVNPQNLAKVLDKCTTAAGGTRTPVLGLVNVNTASKQVLSLLPGFDENLAQQVLDARGTAEGDQKSSIAWLVAQNVLEPDKFKEVAPYLTARSLQFRVRCVGFGAPSGRFCVVEAVVDLASGTPTTVYTRDLTHLGMPVPVVPEQLPGPTLK